MPFSTLDIFAALTWELELEFPPEWTPSQRIACMRAAERS
jgi:hypothetical protein